MNYTLTCTYIHLKYYNLLIVLMITTFVNDNCSMLVQYYTYDVMT